MASYSVLAADMPEQNSIIEIAGPYAVDTSADSSAAPLVIGSVPAIEDLFIQNGYVDALHEALRTAAQEIASLWELAATSQEVTYGVEYLEHPYIGMVSPLATLKDAVETQQNARYKSQVVSSRKPTWKPVHHIVA